MPAGKLRGVVWYCLTRSNPISVTIFPGQTGRYAEKDPSFSGSSTSFSPMITCTVAQRNGGLVAIQQTAFHLQQFCGLYLNRRQADVGGKTGQCLGILFIPAKVEHLERAGAVSGDLQQKFPLVLSTDLRPFRAVGPGTAPGPGSPSRASVGKLRIPAFDLHEGLGRGRRSRKDPKPLLRNNTGRTAPQSTPRATGLFPYQKTRSKASAGAEESIVTGTGKWRSRVFPGAVRSGRPFSSVNSRARTP